MAKWRWKPPAQYMHRITISFGGYLLTIVIDVALNVWILLATAYQYDDYAIFGYLHCFQYDQIHARVMLRASTATATWLSVGPQRQRRWHAGGRVSSSKEPAALLFGIFYSSFTQRQRSCLAVPRSLSLFGLLAHAMELTPLFDCSKIFIVKLYIHRILPPMLVECGISKAWHVS